VNLTQPYGFNRRWYSAALRQIAEARWRRQPLTIITGPAGAGKTTLCRQVADRDVTRTFVVLISTPPASANAFLKELACELDVLSRTAGAAASINTRELQQAVHHAIAGLAALGADCLVIVDDADRLEPQAVDEIRTLLDACNQRRPALQVVLVGGPSGELDRAAVERPAIERPAVAIASPAPTFRPVLVPPPTRVSEPTPALPATGIDSAPAAEVESAPAAEVESRFAGADVVEELAAPPIDDASAVDRIAQLVSAVEPPAVETLLVETLAMVEAPEAPASHDAPAISIDSHVSELAPPTIIEPASATAEPETDLAELILARFEDVSIGAALETEPAPVVASSATTLEHPAADTPPAVQPEAEPERTAQLDLEIAGVDAVATPIEVEVVAETPVVALTDAAVTHADAVVAETADAAVAHRFSFEDEAPPKRRRMAMPFRIAAAIVAGAGLWYGIARHNANVNQAAAAQAAKARTHAAEAALAAIVAEAEATEKSDGRQRVLLPDGPAWTDEVSRRAGVLARRPDVEGLVALRQAVEERRSREGADTKQVDAVLHQLDQILEDARRRRLVIDRQELLKDGHNK
jgi:hypothetical protein